ncbi:MAG: NAD(P)H-dependent oxidoreductase [Flavobacteriales bacterium]|nr:NAD(P)H-dependent oxidoreductase [Flavobacteriales bacterium]
MDIIENLKWRSATKKFDPSKKVSEADIETLIEAASLAPTSAGLQPFKLVIVRNQEIKAKMKAASYDQSQVVDASHVLVFAVQSEIGDRQIDDYLERVVEVRNVELASLAGYKEMISGFLSMKDDAAKQDWAARQAYIALGTLITAAAEMKIDICPMEGFDPMAIQEILDLKSKGLTPVVVLPVGYRADDDMYAKALKVRKSRENFVLNID